MIGINDKEVSIRVQEVIKDARAKSLRAFALSINIDPSLLAKVVKGTRAISDSIVVAIGEKYKVRQEWLLYGQGHKYGQINPQQTPPDLIIESGTLLTGAKVTLQDYINQIQARNEELLADKAFLQELLKSNLTGLSEGQQVLFSFVRLAVEYQAAIASRGDKKKEKELLDSLSKRLFDLKNMNLKEDKALSLHK